MLAEIYPLQVFLMTFSGLVNRHQADVITYLVEENRVLKEQMKGRKLRLTDDQRRRLAAKAKFLGRKALNQVATIVTPDTLLRWHRRLIAFKWTFEAKPVSLGHGVARSTIAKVLKENGIKPAPDRPSSWRSFLRAHWGQIAGMDFFTTEVWTPHGLVTHYVLFVIDLKTRRVQIAGITRSPDERFMAQVARNLTDCVDGFLRDHRFLILDRDSKFTKQFKNTLESAGVNVILSPFQAPNCNAFAERFVLSIKSECLNRMIFFGEGSFRRACSSFLEHYHSERAHQGLGNERIERVEYGGAGEVECSERLGGLLKHYRRAA